MNGRKTKAASLVPLAMLSAVVTTTAFGIDSSATAGKKQDTDLPDGSAVPSQAIKAPASVPVPGAIAPAVPDGTADAVVAGASTSGIPSAALSAYQRGAQIIDAADTTCNIPWELIAAIGRVESNHGQFGGNTLGSDGVSRPGVYGPQLNGKNGTQAITDTDGGQLDHDPVYDRAVGPMQFIPSTWSAVKVDADGDGQRNPQDIDDASLASAVYLCSGDDDLSSRSGQEAAVFRYNHSREYVDLVLRIMEAYSRGDYTAIPSGTYGGTIFSPSASSTIKSRQHQTKTHSTTATTPTTSSGTSTTTPSGSGSSSSHSTTPSTPKPPSTGTPLDQATQNLTATVTKGVQPVIDTLSTLAEATNFCSSQLNAISDPLNLLNSTVASLCAPKVKDMTEPEAAAAIPNSPCAVLGWLGLPVPLVC